MAGSYIRFVGGPKHNEVQLVELRPHIYVAVREPLAALCKPGAATVPPPPRQEFYRLMRFYTEHKTIYSQYVHESLLRHGDPPFAAYGEVFPEMKFDPRPLLALRGR